MTVKIKRGKEEYEVSGTEEQCYKAIDKYSVQMNKFEELASYIKSEANRYCVGFDPGAPTIEVAKALISRLSERGGK